MSAPRCVGSWGDGSSLLTGRRWSYQDALGFQDKAGHMSHKQVHVDGVMNPLHQVRLEGVPRGHLQEEDHLLLPILVILGDTQAALHLLEGVHCGDRRGHTHTGVPSVWGRASQQPGRAGGAGCDPQAYQGCLCSPSPPRRSALEGHLLRELFHKWRKAHHWGGRASFSFGRIGNGLPGGQVWALLT